MPEEIERERDEMKEASEELHFPQFSAGVGSVSSKESVASYFQDFLSKQATYQNQ